VVSDDCHGDGKGVPAEVCGWLRKPEEGAALIGRMKKKYKFG